MTRQQRRSTEAVAGQVSQRGQARLRRSRRQEFSIHLNDLTYAVDPATESRPKTGPRWRSRDLSADALSRTCSGGAEVIRDDSCEHRVGVCRQPEAKRIRD